MDQAAPSPPPRSPPSSALEAGVEIGDFRIERRLGAGGMGVVYQARQISLNRLVALKVLGQALTRSADVTRFQREAQAAARLKHPAIAQVYFIGQDRHVCFLAMELIEGASLRKVLDRLGTTATADSSIDSVVLAEVTGDTLAQEVRFDVPTCDLGESTMEARIEDMKATAADGLNPYLSPQARELRTTAAYVRRVVEVIRDAAQALAHAHEQGVIHRDIKPDNLLLDRKGRVHLIDFGVARFFDDQSVTYTGQLVGTPLYMSPEQVTGRGTIDARTDLYSLGLVLYELLTLRPPIEATNRENLLRTIVTKPLPPVSWRNGAVKSDLERIVHKATQKDPDQRYASGGQLAADLDRFLSGQPVAAAPYYFRLDEREITAARPGPVVLAAVDFFVMSVFLFLAFTSFALMMGVMLLGIEGGNYVGLSVGAIQLVMGITILVVGVAIGLGILAARTWARWAGVVCAGLLVLASIGGLFLLGAGVIAVIQGDMFKDVTSAPAPPQGLDGDVKTVPFSPRNMLIGSFLMYSVPLLAGIVIGGTALWGLVCRSAQRWFEFAREIRTEHHRVRQELAG